jgi:hypothetical protein
MATIHASAVLVGSRAVLIRGASGSGKSSLVLALLAAGKRGELPLARLVADDRVHLDAVNGRLVARAPSALAGLIEMRGHGPVALPHEPRAVIGWVVDLGASDGARLPPAEAFTTEIAGIILPRVVVSGGHDPFQLVLRAIGAGFAP